MRHAPFGISTMQPGARLGVLTPFNDPDQRIASSEMQTRYLALNDPYSTARLAWLGAVFENFEVHAYASEDTRFISTAYADFDVLVIGGNDHKRIAPVYRRFRPILRRKAVVALMRGSTPQKRARLILAGFDDVMDIERTPPIEAAARLRAIHARHCLRRVQEAQARRQREALAAICEVDRLTAKERRLLATLIVRPGRPVTVEALQRDGGNSHEPITAKNLKVSLSALRKKLRPGVSIVFDPGTGYVLRKPAPPG